MKLGSYRQAADNLIVPRKFLEGDQPMDLVVGDVGVVLVDDDQFVIVVEVAMDDRDDEPVSFLGGTRRWRWRPGVRLGRRPELVRQYAHQQGARVDGHP